MSLIDNDFYLYEVAEEELPNQVDDKYEDDEDDSFSASYSYKDSSEDSWDEEGCEEGYFLYGKLNKEVEKLTYTGASTETADTLVDDFTSTIAVNVKQSPKDLSRAYIDKKTNEIVFIARDGSEISRTQLSPFVQEQSDLSETDPSSETFVKGKKTSNLENDGPPGQDPSLPPDKYVTESQIAGISGDKTFVFTQRASSKTWVIAHDLDKYPSTVIVDSANNNVYGGQVHYIDRNNLEISFSSAFSGIAYLN